MKDSVTRIAIFYPCDPLGFVPSGIDSFIRGILKWAPKDLSYTLFGATTDAGARPPGKTIHYAGLHRDACFVPVVTMDPSARQTRIPLALRYMTALRRRSQQTSHASFDILDFHRPEPALLFRHDPRPKNLVLHQDMAVIRGESSDIRWRHWPWLYEAFETYILRRVEHVFCVRQSAIDRYRARYPGSESKFEFIPTWVDVETFSPCADKPARDDLRKRVRAELGFAADAVLLVSVGRLDRQKDPVLLLDALRVARMREPRLRLAMIGDGVLRPQVEERIRANGIGDNVRLLGALPPARIADCLRASDLFALSSAYEGMPIAVLEALAAGLPVVTTDVGEVRLVVTSGINGTISTAHTPDALADAFLLALSTLDSMRDTPCTDSVKQYGPDAVLGRVYQLHRAQAARGRGEMGLD